MEFNKFKALCLGASALEDSHPVAADFLWKHIFSIASVENTAIEACNRQFGHPSLNRDVIKWTVKYRELVGCDTGEAIRAMKKLRGF